MRSSRVGPHNNIQTPRALYGRADNRSSNCYVKQQCLESNQVLLCTIHYYQVMNENTRPRSRLIEILECGEVNYYTGHSVVSLMISKLECCTGQGIPYRSRPLPQATLPRPSRSRQSGSRSVPLPYIWDFGSRSRLPIPQEDLFPT